MAKKYIFVDLDGTIINHKTNSVSDSTKLAIKKLMENGHEVIMSTGRVPAIFYGVDKELGIDSYIAANGRIVVYKEEVIFDKYMDKNVVKDFVSLAYNRKIDIAFESFKDYVLNSNFDNLSDKFSEEFHLGYPNVVNNYHLSNNIYQMVLFYNKPDYKKFEVEFPTLRFNFSNKYGLDVNEKGGLKEMGIKILIEKLQIDIKDTIAIGDGFNDVSMIEFVEIGIAMGNSCDLLKEAADIVTDDIDNDGFYNAFKKLNLI